MVEFLFNKFQAHNFIKRKQVFSCEYCKIFKNTFFLQNNSGGFFCIVQLIVLCNLGPSRPKQNCVGYFPSKSLLRAQSQYCTSNFLVQCCLRRIWTTLSIRFSNAEEVVWRFSVKKVFLKISQNSQKNICARVSF